MEAGSRKCLKIFAVVTGIFFIITLVVLVVLFVTILKPKDPSVFTEPVSLEGFELVGFPVIKLNISIRILVTVKNPNYGGFKYENSTAHISYHGNVVAEAPIKDDTVPARSTHNMTTVLSILADKLVTDSHFLGELVVGVLNFTSETTLHGKVNLWKIFKMKATSYTADCNISITIGTQSADSVCKSRVKLNK